jgi:hypothetical protein
MEWTALENQILQNRCKLLELCFQDSLKKPCRMLTSFAVLSPRFFPEFHYHIDNDTFPQFQYYGTLKRYIPAVSLNWPACEIKQTNGICAWLPDLRFCETFLDKSIMYWLINHSDHCNDFPFYQFQVSMLIPIYCYIFQLYQMLTLLFYGSSTKAFVFRSA